MRVTLTIDSASEDQICAFLAAWQTLTSERADPDLPATDRVAPTIAVAGRGFAVTLPHTYLPLAISILQETAGRL